ncbi:MAG: N-acetylglucosamine-6-phosphate deacetylase [Litoreibacter sp.]|uniref:N-acetylglucosamine-6-phosphate deacetylase n=1 Tax=Litoreibacter sp. TaxID=1969459 RepID=UPI00329A64FC
MTLPVKAFVGAKIHDGKALHERCALIVHDDGKCCILAQSEVPTTCVTERLSGGIITPGFVDLQVNGGGGVMFNDDQSVDALRTITSAHASKGTVAILPTLITDTAKKTRAAIDAVEQAIKLGVKGIVGIHLEGPHLSVTRKGAHDPSLIRQMDEDDLDMILDAAQRLPNVKVTVAPENTSLAQIRAMSDAGIIVSLGHTDADFKTCLGAFDAGACCVTHLYNAMSQMGNREPGLVGATLSRSDVYAGVIADGIHVHPSSIRVALDAKPDNDKIFLVSDAMAVAGSEVQHFILNGRKVTRSTDRLTLPDGTLAGADLDLPQAVSVMITDVGDSEQQAIARATSTPASILGNKGELGGLTHIEAGINYFSDTKNMNIRNLATP